MVKCRRVTISFDRHRSIEIAILAQENVILQLDAKFVLGDALKLSLQLILPSFPLISWDKPYAKVSVTQWPTAVTHIEQIG